MYPYPDLDSSSFDYTGKNNKSYLSSSNNLLVHIVNYVCAHTYIYKYI